LPQATIRRLEVIVFRPTRWTRIIPFALAAVQAFRANLTC
jgi:hypothetical protein